MMSKYTYFKAYFVIIYIYNAIFQFIIDKKTPIFSLSVFIIGYGFELKYYWEEQFWNLYMYINHSIRAGCYLELIVLYHYHLTVFITDYLNLHCNQIWIVNGKSMSYKLCMLLHGRYNLTFFYLDWICLTQYFISPRPVELQTCVDDKYQIASIWIFCFPLRVGKDRRTETSTPSLVSNSCTSWRRNPSLPIPT